MRGASSVKPKASGANFGIRRALQCPASSVELVSGTCANEAMVKGLRSRGEVRRRSSRVSRGIYQRFISLSRDRLQLVEHAWTFPRVFKSGRAWG
jgi:hypothetical protein